MGDGHDEESLPIQTRAHGQVSIWLPSVMDIVAENMKKAAGWVKEEPSIQVFAALQQVSSSRRATW